MEVMRMSALPDTNASAPTNQTQSPPLPCEPHQPIMWTQRTGWRGSPEMGRRYLPKVHIFSTSRHSHTIHPEVPCTKHAHSSHVQSYSRAFVPVLSNMIHDVYGF
jgi:hypothetical protein